MKRVAPTAVPPRADQQFDAWRAGTPFRVKLESQNCHRVAAFRPEAVGGAAYRPDFVSPRAQLRNQSPEPLDR
jgi:hypothetical protein